MSAISEILRAPAATIAEAIARGEWESPAPSQPPAQPPAQAHDYGCLMLDLPYGVASWVKATQYFIRQADLSTIEDKPLPDDPHVTVRYGFGPDVTASAAFTAIAQAYARLNGGVTVTLGPMSVFQNKEGDDILHLPVLDPTGSLAAVRAATDGLPHPGETHPTYKPHVTIAYLRPGAGARYKGPTGIGDVVELRQLRFSGTDGQQAVWQLGDEVTNRGVRRDAEWDESKHPRDSRGRFGTGEGMSRAEHNVARDAWTKSLTPAEKLAVDKWTQEGYQAIRALQKDPSREATDYNRQLLANWQSAIATAPPYRGTVYRGLAAVGGAESLGIVEGGTFTLKADSSASKKEQAAEDFTRLTADRISSDTGDRPTKIIFQVSARSGADISHLGSDGESEVIMRKGTTYDVAQVLVSSNRTRVWLKERSSDSSGAGPAEKSATVADVALRHVATRVARAVGGRVDLETAPLVVRSGCHRVCVLGERGERPMVTHRAAQVAHTVVAERGVLRYRRGACAARLVVHECRAAELPALMAAPEGSLPPAARMTAAYAKDFDESKHPRVPAGQPGGGEFGAGEGEAAPATADDDEGQNEGAKENPCASCGVRKEVQQYAEEHNEPALAHALGGVSLRDNEPVDILLSQGGVIRHGVELKTMVTNVKGAIVMNPDAQDRKGEWIRENRAPLSTVVLDDRKVFNALGPGQHDESKREIYYRRGYGSFSLTAMYKCRDIEELKQLLATPTKGLPALAKPPKTYPRFYPRKDFERRDFDESKHPRDAHGRWSKGDDVSAEEAKWRSMIQKQNKRDAQDPEKKRVLDSVLSHGGGGVLFDDADPDAHNIAKYGKYASAAGSKLIKGEANSCHWNAASSFMKSPSKYLVMTGFALSDDGAWRSHTWLMDKSSDKPVETTVKRSAYWGWRMDRSESEAFAKRMLKA